MEYFYKVLREGGVALYSGMHWTLPVDGEEWGAWMPPIDGKLVIGANAYHLLTVWHLPYWLDRYIHPAQVSGEVIMESKQVLVRQARIGRPIVAWTPATMGEFARACAGRARRYTDSAVAPSDIRTANQCAIVAHTGANYASSNARHIIPAVISGVIVAAANARAAASAAAPINYNLAAYYAEARMQAEWLAEHLGLPLK